MHSSYVSRVLHPILHYEIAPVFILMFVADERENRDAQTRQKYFLVLDYSQIFLLRSFKKFKNNIRVLI